MDTSTEVACMPVCKIENNQQAVVVVVVDDDAMEQRDIESRSSQSQIPEQNDREEGEIVDDYEDIISSEEEFNLRQRIEELEARNLELEKIAAISSLKPNEYGLGSGKTTYINLVDDDNDNFDEIDSVHHYTTYRMSSAKSKRSSRRERPRDQKHERKKKYRKHRYLKSSSKKAHRNVRQPNDNFSSDEECILDREKLKAALKRDNRSPNNITSLKRKLQGVKQTVSAFIDQKATKTSQKDDFNEKILELLDDLTNDRSASHPDVETISDIENESISLEEQELRLIALKSAIVKKHEARRRRKVNEMRPYSPTDTDIIMDISRCPSVQPFSKDDLDNMEISPVNSPASFDKSLLPVDMELVSSDSSNEPIFISEDSATKPMETGWISIQEIPLPNERKLGPDKISSFEIFKPISDAATKHTKPIDLVDSTPLLLKPKEEVIEKTQKEKDEENALLEEEEENALRALLLAKLNSPKARNKKPISNTSPAPQSKENVRSMEIGLDTNVEAEEIRRALLSTLNKKDTLVDSGQIENREINLPKIALNLKDAVKRIKNKYLAKPNHQNRVSNHKCPSSRNSNLIVIDLNKNIKINNLASELHANNTHRVSNHVADNEKKPTEADTPSGSKDDELSVTEKSVEELTESKRNSLPSIISESNRLPSSQIIPAKSGLTVPKPSNKPTNEIKTLENTIRPIEKEHIPSIQTFVTATTLRKRVQNIPQTELKRPKLSPITTLIPMKPVNKLIIQLRQSDSDSDEMFAFDDEESLSTNLQTETDRIIDNASPSSIVMDSPSFSPSSPIQSNSTMNNDLSNKDAPSSATANIQNDFQKKLDEFLKSARLKVESTPPTAVKVIQNQTVQMVTKPITPLAVRHLPASAQLEYRQLVNRMSLLEKQKNLKIHALAKKRSIHKRLQPISVTIDNNSKLTDVKVIVNNSGRTVQTKPPSLVKQVLVKNVSMKAQQETAEQSTKNPLKTESDADVSPNILPLEEEPVNPESNAEIDNEITNETEEIKMTVINENEDKDLSPPNGSVIQEDKSCSEKPNAISKSPNLSSKSPITADSQSPQAKPSGILSQKTKLGSTSNGKKLSFTHIKNLSMTKKLDALQSAENEYSKHSTTFLQDMEKLCKLLCTAQVAKQKQIDMERELEILRLKTQQIEQYIDSQKSIISKLYPTISTSHKRILSSRTKSVQLSSHCSKLGKFINGIEYKIPNDVKELIIEKLRNICTETKTLKGIKLQPVDLSEVKTFKRKQWLSSSTQTDNTMDDETKDAPTEHEVPDQLALSYEIHCNKSDCKSKSLISASTNTESIQIVDKGTQFELEDAASRHVTDSKGSLGKYRSPLDHMQNESSNNPNAILCPFQLMGQCEDKECSYKHLTS